MTVVSGSQCKVSIDGLGVTRGRGWTLNLSRNLLPIGCVARLDGKYRPSVRSGAGSLSLLYDLADPGGQAVYDAILDDATDVPITLELLISDPGDPLYPQVIYLLNMDGTDGSREFIDSSLLNRTTLVFGNAGILGNKLVLDGNGDYLRADATPNGDLLPATGDFTIEGMFKTNTIAQNNQVIIGQYTNGQNGAIMRLLNSGGLKLSAYLENTNYYGTTLIEAGREYHAALTRESDVWRLWLDGQLEMQVSRAFSLSQVNGIYTGAHTGPSAYFNGTLDDIRVTTEARYRVPFTPPSAPNYTTEYKIIAQAHITGERTAVSVGAAHAVQLDFQVTGPLMGNY